MPCDDSIQAIPALGNHSFPLHFYHFSMRLQPNNVVPDAFGKRVFLHFKIRRFDCETCRSPFTEEIDGIGAKRRHTERFEEELYRACLNSPKNRIAQEKHLNESVVRGIFKRIAKKLYDPRSYLKKAEEAMAARISDACDHLKSTGTTLYK